MITGVPAPAGVAEVVAHLRAAPPRLGAVRSVAVDGPSGSGKSTFADELISACRAEFDARLVRTDDFATWDEPVEWWPRLAEGVLAPLRRGLPGAYRRTEWPGGVPRLGARVAVEVPEVLVLEGVSAARREVRPFLSTVVWLEVPDPAERLARAVARDGVDSRAQLGRWQRFEDEWFAADRTRAAADVLVLPG